MSPLRALLLTDVVDSLQLAQRLGDAAMVRLWAAHDCAARDLLPRWRGREIDRSDGLLLIFECVDDAAGYARDYHRALQGLEHPLQARAGLHLGAVSLRANRARDVALGAKPFEIDGLAKAVTARIAALACAGQTLLSTPARRALTDAAGAGSIGRWRLKGLDGEVELHALDAAEGAAVIPPDGDKAWRAERPRAPEAQGRIRISHESSCRWTSTDSQALRTRRSMRVLLRSTSATNSRMPRRLP